MKSTRHDIIKESIRICGLLKGENEELRRLIREQYRRTDEIRRLERMLMLEPRPN
jgi:hypothetical protein